MTRRWGAAAGLLLVLSACGTTVPQLTSQGAPPAAGGLAGPAPAATGPAVVTGVLPARGSGGSPADPGRTSTGPHTGGTLPAAPGAVQATTATGPLTVGLTYINNDQTSQALGVSDATTASKQNVVRALVRGLDDHGGVGGRRLKVVEYEWNSQSNDWSSDANAACARFTQDNHVAVVIDNAFGTIGGFRDCLQRKGVLVIGNGPDGDDVSSVAARLHANTYNMTTDRAYVAVLDGLSATGYLTAASRAGVIVESCPETTRAWSRSVEPRLARLVRTAPQVATISCTRGFSDAGAAASAVSNDVLRFRSAGVDRVMFVSDNESVLLLLFASAAASQSYSPGYLLSSAAQAQALRSQLPASQQPQLHGVGQLPFGDTDGAPLRPVDVRCRDLAHAGGVSPASYADYGVVMFECGPLLLLDAALRASHGVATAGALVSAIDGLGEAFQGPGLVGGATAFSSSRHDGPDQVRVFAYQAGCTCMRYTSAPRPAPQ